MVHFNGRRIYSNLLKTNNYKTDTSIRQTLSSVLMSNYHCKLSFKMDNSDFECNFHTKRSNFVCHLVNFILLDE